MIHKRYLVGNLLWHYILSNAIHGGRDVWISAQQLICSKISKSQFSITEKCDLEINRKQKSLLLTKFLSRQTSKISPEHP